MVSESQSGNLSSSRLRSLRLPTMTGIQEVTKKIRFKIPPKKVEVERGKRSCEFGQRVVVLDDCSQSGNLSSSRLRSLPLPTMTGIQEVTKKTRFKIPPKKVEVERGKRSCEFGQRVVVLDDYSQSGNMSSSRLRSLQLPTMTGIQEVTKKIRFKIPPKKMEVERGKKSCEFGQRVVVLDDCSHCVSASGNKISMMNKSHKSVRCSSDEAKRDIAAINIMLKLPAPGSRKRHKPSGMSEFRNEKRQKMDCNVSLQCGKLLKTLMKHPFSWGFLIPVDPMALDIPDYFSIISHPMDLGTVKSKLRNNEYFEAEEFAADVRLTFLNSMLYDRPHNNFHQMAKELYMIFRRSWKSLEANWGHKRKSVNWGCCGSGKAETAEDLQKASHKRYKPSGMLEFQILKRQKMDCNVSLQCGKLLKTLMNHPYSQGFLIPVDPVVLAIPDYFSSISHPMDLGTVKSKLRNNEYFEAEEFAADVRLTFLNSIYNPSHNNFHQMAKELYMIFGRSWKSLEADWGHERKSFNWGFCGSGKAETAEDLQKARHKKSQVRVSMLGKTSLSSDETKKLRNVLAEAARGKMTEQLKSFLQKIGLEWLEETIEKDTGSLDDKTVCELKRLLNGSLNARAPKMDPVKMTQNSAHSLAWKALPKGMKWQGKFRPVTGSGTYDFPLRRPGFQVDSFGFAPGPYRPSSQNNSAGWLNE